MSRPDPAAGALQPGHVAVVGLACRFPGAKSAQEFWQNLETGTDSIDRFDEISREPPLGGPAGGREERILAYGVLDGIEDFDAGLFGFSQNEAVIADPQQRLSLEVGFECLIDAGCDSRRFPGEIGVFAGCSLSTYLINQILPDVTHAASLGGLPLLLRNDKDHLATLLAYKLGLTGPAVLVGTSCSSSLAAVHFAAQSLLSHECDLALAGGASILVPQRQGHLRQDYGIYSNDGYCRVFDHRANGVVGGNGVGFVALKRLEDALSEGNTVYAVLLGSAINNDGNRKIGYSAPSAERQAAVIAMAHAVADVTSDTITMVEAHGTGTLLGDPIEIEALTRAFRQTSQGVGFCAIGSVKSNIGHLDAAAGIAGFIKAALALKHGVIPPTLHFERPNPELALQDSPFFVNGRPRPWRPECGLRRAGVSGFGMGGTNVHVVLQEPPAEPRSEPWIRRQFLIPASAHDADSLDRWCRSVVATQLSQQGCPSGLGEVAYTSATDRPSFACRKAIVASTVDEFASKASRPQNAVTMAVDQPRLVVMFGESDATSREIHRRAYNDEPGYRRELDRLSTAYRGVSSLPKRPFPDDSLDLADPGMQLALCFWAWGAWLERLGLRPDVLIGAGWGIPAALAMSKTASEEAILHALARLAANGSAPPSASSLAMNIGEHPNVPLLLSDSAAHSPGTAVWRDVATNELTSNPAAWLARTGGKLLMLDFVGAQGLLDPGDGYRNRVEVLGIGGDADTWYRVWLESLAVLWESGRDLDWSAFYDTRSWRRAKLPAYSFSHRRFWFDPDARRTLPPLDTCSDALRARYERQTEATAFRPIAAYPDLQSELDAYCLDLIWQALRGAFAQSLSATTEQIASRIRLHPEARPFFEFMIRTIVSAGIVTCNEELLTVAPGANRLNAGTDAVRLAQRYPAFSNLISLVGQFGNALAASLHNPAAGMAMFGEALRDGRLRSALEQPSPTFSDLEACCRLGADLIGHLADHKPHLRVLEVGAGGLIFPQFMERLLRTRPLDYWVTDASSSQVEQARSLLDRRSLGHVHTATIDIMRDFGERREELSKFDVIVGLNVVHACPDVSRALLNLRSALASDGYLILLEAVDRALWRTMIWGWAKGWWDFTDHRRRNGQGPLLDAEGWCSAIQALSPAHMVRVPDVASELQTSDTVLVAAQFTHEVRNQDAIFDTAFGLPPKDPDPARWLYRLSFERSSISIPGDEFVPKHWIVLRDASPLASILVRKLGGKGFSVTQVSPGRGFRRIDDDCYEVRPASRDDFSRVLDGLADRPGPVGILHLWTVDGLERETAEGIDAAAFRMLGIHTIASLSKAVADGRGKKWQFVCLMKGLNDVFGTEKLCPHHAVTQAALKVIPREYPHIGSRIVDIDMLPDESDEKGWQQLLALITAQTGPEIVSHRGAYQWTVSYQRVEEVRSSSRGLALREQGRYVLFGGMGGIGYSIARQLAERYRARLLLVGRSVSMDDGAGDIRLENLTRLGGTAAAFQADLADIAGVSAALAEADLRYGGIDGVIHCAGVLDEGGVIAGRSIADTEAAIAAKVTGACNLGAALEGRRLDFLLLFSSIGSILHKLKFGEVGYVAGNDFLDAFARHHASKNSFPARVIHWPDWQQDGMWARSRTSLAETYRVDGTGGNSLLTHDLLGSITDEEGFDTLQRALRLEEPSVIVSTLPLASVLDVHGKYQARDYGRILNSAGLRPVGNVASPVDAGRMPEHDGADGLTVLRSIWEEVIGQSVADNDNFFTLGGDSLLALRIISQVETKLDIDLPLDVFFSAPILHEMAMYIENIRWAAGRAEPQRVSRI